MSWHLLIYLMNDPRFQYAFLTETKHPFIPADDDGYKAKRPAPVEPAWGALVPIKPSKYEAISLWGKTFHVTRSLLAGIYVDCVFVYDEDTKKVTFEVVSSSGSVYVEQRPIRKGKEAVVLSEGTEIGFYFSETYVYHFTYQANQRFPAQQPAALSQRRPRPAPGTPSAPSHAAPAPTLEEVSRRLLYTPRPPAGGDGALSYLPAPFRAALLHEFRHSLFAPAGRDYTRIAALSRTLLLTAPPGAELYVQRLVREVADVLGVKVLEVDCTKLSVLDGVEQAPLKTYHVGDRVKYIGRGNDNEEQLGKLGTVLFVSDGKVAVNFENDANENRGAFVEPDLLGAVDEDIPSADRRLIGKLPAIIRQNRPVIVCLQRIDELGSVKPDIQAELRTFITTFKGCGESILVGCGTSAAPARTAPKKALQPLEPGFCVCDKTEMRMMDNAFLMKCAPAPRSGAKSLMKLFGNTMAIEAPTGPSGRRWWAMMQEDGRRIKAAAAIRHLQDELKRVDVACDDFPESELEVDLTKEDAERIVGWAIAYEATASGTVGRVSRDALSRAVRLHQHIAPGKDAVDGVEAENEFETRLLQDVVRARDLSVGYDDIGALEGVKATLHEAITLPLLRPELFRTGGLARGPRGILLFGPPGTGKTMLAKAVATTSRANFINASLSSLESKWFGEAEKYVKALFTLAEKLAPCVVFVDEVDALLGKRSSVHENETLRKMKNEFMTLWDGLRSGAGSQVVVLGATNRPFDLDDAVLRRFTRRVLVDLPDRSARERILSVILRDEGTSADIGAIAARTEGFSGSDLHSLCCAAAMQPVKEALARERRGEAVGALRRTTDADFDAVLGVMAPSTHKDAGTLAKLREWNSRYGEGGAGSADVLPYFV